MIGNEGSLLWPVYFLLLGGDQEQQVASLKGQYKALEAEAVKKGCVLPAGLIAPAEETKPKDTEESKG